MLAAAWAPGALGAQPGPAAPPADQILSDRSLWRCSFVLRRPVVRVGKDLKALCFNGYGGVWMVPDGKKADMGWPMPETAAPPAGWTAADFDDQTWTRLPGPFFPSHHGHAYCKEVDDAGYLYFEDISPNLAAICVRGKFLVADPAAASDLKLSLAFRGGVVAYLNGQEIARANIPEEEKAKGIEALAEDYPQEVFVKPDGKPISWGFGDPQKHHALLQKRVRRLSDVTVPAKLLRKGANVLAVEAHRTPYHESLFGTSDSGRGKGYIINWCTVGITRIGLTAGGTGVSPNVARPAGLQVWNQPLAWRPKSSDYGDPCEPLKPIRLVGARNGAFSGAVMVGSTAPLRGLKAVAGELKGPGAIPASAVTVRYALSDREADLGFEILSPEAPAEVAADKDGGAVLPVWITVKVPADAKPGEYKGAVTVSADGAKPVEVGVEMRVADWAMPDPKSFVSHIGLTQSPESVAMRYKAELWSPEHWTLLEQCFAMLGQVGADDVFITALRRTHHGNEHSMIRWVKGPDGALKPDFGIAEKYLDLAVKHLGKVPVVCVYCWEPVTGSSYLGGAASQNRGLPITVVDPATGKLEDAEGPKWGTPEVREFWKPVFDGMREILKKRGLEGSLMVGVAGDNRPNKDTVEDLKAVAPDARWVVQSHAQADKLFGQPVGYLADVWSSPSPPDPAVKRVYGWNNPFLRTAFPRYNNFTLLRTFSPLAQYRVASEATSASGIRGIGRVGADFWNVLESKRSTYGGGRDIIARYPESDWGQLYLGNSTSYVLAPGPKGPLASARFEMLREGAQDLEARVFLEKALLDPAGSAKLGEDLAGRCHQLLDDRVRAILIGRNCWQFFCGEQERLEKLYGLAGEVAGKLGKP